MNKSQKNAACIMHVHIYIYTCKDTQAYIDLISSNRWQHEKNRIHTFNTSMHVITDLFQTEIN